MFFFLFNYQFYFFCVKDWAFCISISLLKICVLRIIFVAKVKHFLLSPHLGVEGSLEILRPEQIGQANTTPMLTFSPVSEDERMRLNGQSLAFEGEITLVSPTL